MAEIKPMVRPLFYGMAKNPLGHVILGSDPRDNYGALLIDLRDHESGGHFTGPGYVESRDILGALKFLRSRGQVGPVAAMGHSYGAVPACCLLASNFASNSRTTKPER